MKKKVAKRDAGLLLSSALEAIYKLWARTKVPLKRDARTFSPALSNMEEFALLPNPSMGDFSPKGGPCETAPSPYPKIEADRLSRFLQVTLFGWSHILAYLTARNEAEQWYYIV